MPTQLLEFKTSLISYSCWGSGPEIWIGIHGYGKSSDCFEFLSRQIPADQYTLIAPDLPFHGQTRWKEDTALTVDDLLNIIEAILISAGRSDQSYTILGFSLGGRIALSLTEREPKRIKALILLAPDGLHRSPWYWLATQNRFGNKIFLRTVRQPGWVFFLLQLGKSCRFIDLEFFKLANYYIQDRSAREHLYDRWMSLRKFKPDLNAIRSCIAENKIRVRLLFGRNDPMIPPEQGARFQKGIEQFCQVTVIAEGHQVLQEKYAALIISLLKD
jgi:pimeloyl-ACP methyl ester carboxylesterase